MDLQAYTALMEERMEKSKFPSWEDLCVFLDVWCEEKKVKFTIRQSEALTEEDIRQYPGGAERAWALKYNSVHLGCSSCTSKNCPAFVQLKLSPEEDKLIVAGTSLHHNHDLPDMDVPLQNKRCRVTYPARLPAQMANDISWKFLDPSDLKKLLGLRSAVFEERTQILEELDSLFDADPDVKVKLVFLEGKLLIKSIFLMTSNMQDVAQKFPEHLYVDFIPSFSPGFDFYMVFCEEVGLAWKVCAYCFVKKDAADTLRFIMVSILQSIPTLKIQVKQILVNPEILDTLDLQALIPYTSVRYCLPLVLEVLYRKLSHLAPTAEVQVKNILHNLAHTLSPKVYDWYLNELKAACPPEVFQYYHETWHPRRKLWLNKENSTRAAENTIGVSTRATHQALLDRVGSSPSLHHCLQVVLSDSKPVLTVTTSSQEFTSRPQVIPSVVLETDATVASPEEEEKDEKSLSQLPGDSQSSENPVSEEDREEQLKRSEFYSWADFRSFLDSWCLKKNVLFVIRQSVPLKVNPLKLDLHWRELTESLKYSSVSMGCSVSKSCPASISLKLGPLKDKLVLVKAMLRHNHDTGANIPPPVSRSRLAPPPCLPTRITNDISRKFLERSDLSKLQKFHPAPSEDWTQILNELDILLISDPGAKVKLVFVENRLLVKSIFIMTSPMQDMIQCFPGYLYVDLLSRFGNLIDLYTVYCEDDSSEWKVCAKCIARKRSANLRFLMVSMLQSIQTLTNQVKYITLNPEIQNPLELEPLIPFASLRYCMPLVLEILYEKISHLGSTAEAQIKNFLHILAHTCSPSVYGRYLSELKAACPAEFFQYYYETWHPHRKMWIKKDNRSQIAESNICTLVKFEHQALRAIVYASSSLYHCLHVILHDNMTLLNATSSSHRQDLPSVLDASPADAAQQACESTKEEQLDQTEFSSWEDFCSFLDSWCEERKLMFTVRQSVTLTKEEISQCPSGPVLAQCLKYSTVQLFCTRNSCPALINLKLCPHKEKLIVSNTNFQHNHDLPETDLSPPLKRSKLASTIGLPVQIANNISRKFLEPNDLNTLQRFRSGAFEDRSQVLKELISLLLSDPEAKVKLVFEENKLQVKDIFLMTSSMQQIARCFPGYLYVDFFSGFSPGFDLYTVLCEEENVGWKACAYCIARKGTEDNLKFIVDSVFQSIPVLNSQVKCVTVSPEIQDTLDIEDLVPCASLRYCMPLVLELLYDKISQMNSAEEAQIKDFLHILAHTHSPTVYNQALNELKAACPAEAFQYYYETWHPRWKLWAEEYNSAPDAESSICAYVKSKHQLLAAQMGISPSLHRCLQVVLDDSKTTLHITDSSQDCPSGPAASPAVIQQADAAPMEEWMKQSRFQSWEDLCTFLDTWCEEKKVKFATCQSEALTEEDIRQYPGGAERAWALKYSRVRLGCSSCTSESCPAFIQLKLCPEEDKLIVASTSLLHNHDLPGMDAPPQIKRFRGKHPSRLPANIANDISCKFLEPNDLKELLSLRSTVFEERTCVLKELDTLFVSDPDAKVKLVFYEDKLLIKSIFLMTSNMQDIAQKFPGHLFVDFIACFIPDYDFYIVFCEESGMGWKVCAYCFARKGTIDTLRSIMVSIWQSIPTLKIQIKQIIVNPEMLDTLDPEVVLPRASVRYCMPLVLDILYRKVAHLDATAKAQMKNILHILAHTRSRKVCSLYLNELKDTVPAEVFLYYHETWHPRRKLWMKKDNRTEAAESTIGASVHAMHQALLDQVASSPSLHRCLRVVLGDSKPVFTIPTPSQNFTSRQQMLPSVIQEACESIKEEQLEQTEFSSWEDFCSFLDSWCKERKLAFTLRHSATSEKDEISPCPSGPVLPKYSPVQLFCTRNNCPAFIKLCPQKGKLVVSNTNFQHNHDLPETDLSPPLKRSKQVYTVGLPVQIANNISRKFLDPNDLSTLKRFRFGAFEDRCQLLKELDSLFFSDPEAKVKLVFEENKLQVKDIFLMTSSMQHIAQCSPGYLYVDFFSGFSLGFDLYTVLCEEKNVGWKACAYCIARKGTADNLRFIMVSLFQSIPILKSQVKYMTVSPKIQDPLDVEDLVPCALLRYCTPLVLELLFDKISHMNSAEEDQIKYFLHILAHTHSPTVYNQALNELKTACPAEAFQYYYETWHPCRKLWAEEYNSAQNTESSICAYVKSKHQILTAQMGISPSLHRCLQVVLDDSKTTLHITDSSQEYPSVPDVSPAVVQQKAEVLTSSLAEEETEDSSLERCEDLGISKRQVGRAPLEEQLERNEFHSWKDFCSFMDNWCKERKLTFAVRYSVTLTEEDISQDPWGREVAKSLKYSAVHMACSISTKRTKCPAVIKLRLGPQKDKLIVTNVILHHDHDLPETALLPEMKQCGLTTAKDFPTRLVNDISRKFLELSDLKRLQRFCSDAFEDRTQVLTELGSLIISDPGAKVRLVFVEDKGFVKNIFLMTSHMQDLAHRFAEHLYVDLLADFSPGFALYAIFCEEGMGWKVCAYCLARKGTSDSLRFLMVSMLQSIPKINIFVKYLTVSPEIEDPLDIAALVPYTSVRYCMSLVLELLYSKISHLDSIVEVQIKNILHDLAHSLSPSIYNHSLMKLIAVCPAEIFQYYYDTWHPRKELWVREQGTNQSAEDSICAFVKAKRLALMDRMGTSLSLHRCLQVVLSDSSLVLEDNKPFLAQEAGAATDSTPTSSQQGFLISSCLVRATEGSPLSDLAPPSHIPEDAIKQEYMETPMEAAPETGTPECPALPVSIPLLLMEKEVQESCTHGELLKMNTGLPSISSLPVQSIELKAQAHATLMEEQMEQNRFQSWEDLCTFLDTWCEEKKVRFSIHKSEALTAEDIRQYPGGSGRAWALKYSSVQLGCCSYNSKSCPAFIQLKLHPEEDKLIVAGTSLLHNHNLLAADVPRQIKRGRVMCPTCLPAQMANDISSKFLEPSDLKELLELHSAVFEERTHVLKALNGLFDSNPDAKVKLVFLEDKLLIKNIFLMTSNMQDIAQKFPGHLFVDIISSFSQGFDLYIVFCEEEGQAWKVCAYCFVRKGVADTLKFIMASMLQSIPSMKVQVKQIIVNPEILETVDLQALIPHALLRYCMPLVLEILYHKVSHLGAAAKAQVKTLLHILAHTRTLKVYNRCLNELKAACPAEIFQYYHETWHPRRKLWMVKGNRNLAAESSIGVSVYATHQALLDQVGSSPSLHHCLQVVLGDSKPVLTITEASQKACETIKEEQLEQTEFSSWDDFCSFLDSWCEDRMLLFRICQSAILTKEEVSQCPSGPGLAQRLKYSKVQLSCTRKSCPAFIKLQLCPHKEKLVVYNTSFQHNHDLPETDLSPPLKRSKLASTVGLPVQIANNISRKFLGPNDLSTLQRFRFGAFEDRYQVLKELASLFNFDPEAKVKLVFEENKLLVKDIFLMTSSMQQIARCFPGYLYIDFFSGFSPGFDLYTVLCEEENVGWKACAYCIARKGTADNLKFIVVSLFQCIPILNNQVKCMTVSPEIQDLLAIKDLVPHASLRYCTLLVLELLLHKISHMNSAEGTRIKDFLHIFAHTHSPLAYNQALNGLKAACPAEAFQYYYETWHPCRKMWAEEYNSAPEAESSICAYVKSKHQILTAQMGISPSLHRCLQAVLDDSKTTLPVKDSSQEYPSGPAVISAITRQKVEVPAASLGKEQTEGSPLENCEDVNIPKRRHPDLQKCPTNMLAEKVVENTKELSQDGPRALSRTTLSGSHSRNYVGEAGPEEQLERNEFHSWKDFCSFFDNWCKERKLNFAIRRSTILTEEDISQDPRGSEVAKLLKYSIVHMICSIPTERKNCPAFIKLRLGPQKDKLIVAKAILRHNHDLPKTAPTHKMKQWQMMAPIDLSTRVVNDISRKFLEQCDLRRLQRLHAYAFEDRTQVLAELGSLFLSDPGAKVKLVFEDKRLVKNIFLMTSHMQDLAHRFAGHLYVDLLADFSPGFALYTIFCEEEGMGWKVCAYCLARKDGSDSLRFLMVSVLQSIPKLNTSVKHLTVSPEFEDPLDIEALMPYASVRYCMSLVLELLYSKLSHLDSIVQAQIKKHLLDLAHSLSPEIYSNTLRDLIAVCPADIFRYYSDTWHPRKKLWVREQGENQGAEDSICAFVKAKHLALKGRMGTSSSLHHCLQVVLSDSRTALEERETFLAQETAAATGIAPTGSQQTMRSDNL